MSGAIPAQSYYCYLSLVFACIFISIPCTVAGGWLTNSFLADFKNPKTSPKESDSNANNSNSLERESPKLFVSPLQRKPCELGIYREFSLVAALNTAIMTEKDLTPENLQNILIKRKLLQKGKDAETLKKACTEKDSDSKPELLECAPVGKNNATICVCATSGFFAPLNLLVEEGECVSPNKAWCVIWDINEAKNLAKCAGGGKCQKRDKPLPFPCEELGVCEGGAGPIAEASLTKPLTCPTLTSGSIYHTANNIFLLPCLSFSLVIGL